MEPNNGPGLYISPNNNPNVAELSLLVRMNVFTDETYGHSLSQVNNACLQAIQSQEQNPDKTPGDKTTVWLAPGATSGMASYPPGLGGPQP